MRRDTPYELPPAQGPVTEDGIDQVVKFLMSGGLGGGGFGALLGDLQNPSQVKGVLGQLFTKGGQWSQVNNASGQQLANLFAGLNGNSPFPAVLGGFMGLLHL